MRILVGDILQSKAQTLINTVNCVGVMGKGIALEFKNRFSEMFEDYVIRNLGMLHWLKVKADANLPVRDEEAAFA